MRILVTNDDGIDSRGLHELARALRHLGEVVVAAPDAEYSGAGASLGPLHLVQPEIHETSVVGGISEAWSVTGPPAMCVMFAWLGAFGPPPDLVVAGINPGANVGRAVYHSGTVGAALTARARGITGVAVSQAAVDGGIEGQAPEAALAEQRWETAADVAAAVVEAVASQPPQTPVVLNVNVPNLALEDLRGWRFTEVGRVSPRALAGVEVTPKLGHEGAFHVRMTWGERTVLPADCDGGAVDRGEVSLTFLSGLVAEQPPPHPSLRSALDRLIG